MIIAIFHGVCAACFSTVMARLRVQYASPVLWIDLGADCRLRPP